MLGVVAVAAIVALVTGIAVGPGTHTVDPATSRSQAFENKLEHWGIPVGGTFIDQKHGAVQLERCGPVHPGATAESCQDYIEVTTDGGRTFREHKLPSPTYRGFNHLYVFDATHFVLAQSQAVQSSEAPYPSLRPGDTDRARWTSADAGATWTPVSLDPGASVASIPAGAQILVDGYLGKPTAILGRDGIAHPLTPAQDIMTPDGDNFVDGVPLGDVYGSYFTYDYSAGLDGPTPADNGLRVSRDNGRTWHAVQLPPKVINPSIIGSDGHVWYASAMPLDLDNRFPSNFILASTDGGLTWQKMNTPAADADTWESFAVTPAGGVLFDNGKDIWQATGIGAFVRTDNDVTTSHLIGLGPVAAALRVSATGTIALATTTDGEQWTVGVIH